MNKGSFYIEDEEIVFIKISATGLIKKEANYLLKFSEYDRWQSYLEKMKQKAPKGL